MMDRFTSLSSADLITLQMFGVLFCVFCCVFFLFLAISDTVRRRADIRKRALSDWGGPSGGDGPVKGRSLGSKSSAATSELLSKVERVKSRQSEKVKIRHDLQRAGFFNESAVMWYQSVRLFLFVGLAVTTPLVLAYFAPDLAPNLKLIIVAIVAAAGFLAPSQFVAHRQRQQLLECRQGFPDVMDLLVICTESGLSPRAAIDRISREIAQTYRYLGANLYLVSLELRAGNSLHEALGNLGRRVELDEILSFAALLQQTEQLGTSIADSLRVYSDEMRSKRLSRAEEQAHALPVKLVVPLGLFVFPVMLVVIMLPVVIRIKTALF
jgi:tight adherence protein C